MKSLPVADRKEVVVGSMAVQVDNKQVVVGKVEEAPEEGIVEVCMVAVWGL